MEYIKGRLDFHVAEPTVLSIGKFDGLHRGHELLMDYVFQKKKEGMKAVIFTFDVPPKKSLEQDAARVLTTNEEKMHLFEQIGIDYLIECPFTEEIMHMPAEEFLKKIVEQLSIRCIVAGTDCSFGYQRRGDYRMLQKYAPEYHYEAQIVDKMQYEGRDISSTFIREEIAAGNMEKAELLLGYAYFVQGTVVHGNQIGRIDRRFRRSICCRRRKNCCRRLAYMPRGLRSMESGTTGSPISDASQRSPETIRLVWRPTCLIFMGIFMENTQRSACSNGCVRNRNFRTFRN